jgi:hypothetical protein
MQWLLAPNSQTHAIVAQVTFFQKWHMANVGESGKSSQNGLANVDKSGESSQNCLANVGASGDSLIFPKKAILANATTC